MKYIYSTILCLFGIGLFAQYTPVKNGTISYSRFMKSTTQVVLTDNEAFNSAFIQAIEDNWNLTPVAFINNDEYEGLIPTDEYSFIHLGQYKIGGEKKKVGALALFNGGYNDSDLYLSSSLAYIETDSWGFEKDVEEVLYRIEPMVVQLQFIIEQVYKEDVKVKNHQQMIKYFGKVYNSKAGGLKDKTLLIDKRYEHSKIVSLTEFAEKYQYHYEVVDKDDINEIIKERDGNYAVLISAYNLHKTNMVFDCSSYDIIYVELEESNPLSKGNLDKFDYYDTELLSAFVKKGK